MNEEKVDFLFRAASVFSQSNNKIHDILRSHYFLRCNTLIKEGEASEKRIRCGHCRLEWKSRLCRVKSTKLSKNKRRRNRSDPDKNTNMYNKDLDLCLLWTYHKNSHS
ncbi:unnamed protein product [Leptidea sinapis]|uniref:Uncharacterized protein n=1 Tax=Leptidea sinapis TaxID=189913 RepID=A0A5E4R6T7_9NEOP|nr:unnamed protein product [Leptidea sinapis]